MRIDPNGRALPRGVTYEPKRQRYRVRLYHFDRPIWVSYCSGYAAAMDQYGQARERQRSLRSRGRPSRGIRSYFTALRSRLRRARRRAVS